MSNRGGRPEKWKDEYVRIAGHAAKLGATDREIAEMLGVSERTLNYWKQEHPELVDSLKLAKEAADDRVEKSLYRRALGYSHDAVKIFADPKTGAEQIVPFTEHYPPDTTAAIFWLKNRKPAEWRDRQELTGANGKDLIPEAMTDAEIARRIAFALQKGAQAQEKTH
jgi:DNA-binding XRE family transcriptional regulator